MAKRSFLPKKIKEGADEETKLVGTKVSASLAEYLALFCIADGCTKSSIIRPFIEDWFEDASEQFSEKLLIKQAAERAYEGWQKREVKSMIFQTYVNGIRRKLKRESISEEIIDKIIIRLRHEREKDKANK